MTNKIITIDGQAGVGKGAIAKRIAEYLNYMYVDSGAFYRALTYLVINKNISLEEEDKIITLASKMNLKIIDGQYYLDDINITNELRTNKVSELSAHIACIPEVRKIINTSIRVLVNSNNAIVDGRDAGSYIFPNALKKFYLIADLDTRAQRRHKQNQEIFNNSAENIEQTIEKIKKRDKIESQIKVKTNIDDKNIILIDTTTKNILEVEKEIIKIIEGEEL